MGHSMMASAIAEHPCIRNHHDQVIMDLMKKTTKLLDPSNYLKIIENTFSKVFYYLINTLTKVVWTLSF